jgi:hypothetical protein
MPDASQYTPVFHGISGWQIYAGPRYNGAMEIIHDRWMHLKLVVSGGRAEVYLDSDEPVFVIPELVRDIRPGRIVLTASTAPARFANVQVRKMDDPPLTGGGADAEPVADTVVDTWSVSPPFAGALLEGRHELSDGEIPDGWQRLAAGPRGIANLARLAGVDGEVDTVVAAVTIDADQARTIPARFGFSDRVHVYLNGRLLFSADDGWRTRDYRFLGTIGLHDTVHLALHRGRNELWFAVSESFGGWGIVLDLPDREGLTVGTPSALSQPEYLAHAVFDAGQHRGRDPADSLLQALLVQRPERLAFGVARLLETGDTAIGLDGDAQRGVPGGQRNQQNVGAQVVDRVDADDQRRARLGKAGRRDGPDVAAADAARLLAHSRHCDSATASSHASRSRRSSSSS